MAQQSSNSSGYGSSIASSLWKNVGTFANTVARQAENGINQVKAKMDEIEQKRERKGSSKLAVAGEGFVQDEVDSEGEEQKDGTPANPYPSRNKQIVKKQNQENRGSAASSEDWEEVKKEDITDAEVLAMKQQMSEDQKHDSEENEEDNGGDEFHMIRTPTTKKRQTKMRLLKNGVAKFLQPKKKKRPVEAVPLKPEVLMQPQDAKTSILRVILLVAQTQMENHSSNSHNLHSHNHAIRLLNCLSVPDRAINRPELESLAFYGITDEIKGLRPLVWRILLNYLPLEAEQWDETLRNNHESYKLYKEELIVKPSLAFEAEEEKKKEDQKAAKKQQKGGIRVVSNMVDHPLSKQVNSDWKRYYDDKALWEEIEKDVKRTRVELAFFMRAVDPGRNCQEDITRLEKQQHTKKADLSSEAVGNYIEAHSDALARILFIYARLNAGIKYVQGMNEILAVLYYCFWNFGNEAIISTEYLESDVFFCFSNLMAELKDGFLRDLDKEQNGIDGKCKAMLQVLKLVDPPVYEKLELEKVNPQFYALRWLMLLMCQEFDMANCVRLWDTLFSDKIRFDYLNYVCVAIIQEVREEIIEGDFACCMENLQGQSKKVTDVQQLLNHAIEVKQFYQEKLMYEEARREEEENAAAAAQGK